MKRICLVPLLTLFVINTFAVPKNILLIIADDYGVDSSSLYNSTNNPGVTLPPTPNIASLVTNGVLFSRAYSYPVCSPTRSCLLTGQFGFRTDVGDVIDNGPGLTTAAYTLPKAFTNGAPAYSFSQFGKWHLANAPNSPRNVGGWTNFAGSLIGQLVSSYTNWTKYVNGVPSNNYPIYATTDLVNDATNWISARGTNTWFVWAAFNAPHTPLDNPPQALCPSYPINTLTNARRRFEAMVEALDTEIGRLLKSVDRTNTHIIFLGDNGTANNVLQSPFPGGRGKDTLYEGGTHVPLIISGPSVVNPNRTNATLVNMVDLFPTILELAGTPASAAVPVNVAMDGQSLLPALQNTNTFARRSYSELFGTNIAASVGGRALHEDRYKLIRFANGTNEFYDLQTDAYEGTNLVTGTMTGGQRQYYDRLQYLLYGYTTNTGVRITSPTWTNNQFSCVLTQTANYTLWRCDDVTTGFWSQVTNAVATTNGSSVMLKDVSPPTNRAFYSVVK